MTRKAPVIAHPARPRRRTEGDTEEQRLDRFLARPGTTLLASLRRDELRRRRRIAWAAALALLLCAGLAGVLVLMPIGRGDAGSERAGVPPAAPSDLDRAWALRRSFAPFDETLTAFRRVVDRDATDPAAWRGLAETYYYQGDGPAAIAAFRRSLALDPDQPEARRTLGKLLLALGRPGEAEPVLRRAGDPDLLIKLFHGEGRYAPALTWIERALEKSPADPALERLAAGARRGRVDPDALAAQVPFPFPTSRRTMEGWRHWYRSDCAAALPHFRAALETDAGDPSALNGLGFCLLAEGRPERAELHFRRSLTYLPLNAPALNGLADVLERSGRIDEAIVVWERMVGLHPGPHGGHYGLGVTLFEQGEIERAVPYLVASAGSRRDPRFTQALRGALLPDAGEEK